MKCKALISIFLAVLLLTEFACAEGMDPAIERVLKNVEGEPEVSYRTLHEYASLLEKIGDRLGAKTDPLTAIYSAWFMQSLNMERCVAEDVFAAIEGEGLEIYRQCDFGKLNVHIYCGEERDYLGILCKGDSVLCLQYINDLPSEEWQTEGCEPLIGDYPHFQIVQGPATGMTYDSAYGFFADGSVVMLELFCKPEYGWKTYLEADVLNIMTLTKCLCAGAEQGGNIE